MHIKIINDNGRPWVIECPNDKFVNFFDARYEHSNLGQFVSCYAIDTIIDSNSGLCLDGGIPEWSITADGMNRIREWLKEIIIKFDK